MLLNVHLTFCVLCCNAETEQGVAQAIIRSVIDFKRDPWPRVSDNAKDLVRGMLNPDPKRRLTAQQVLGKSVIFILAQDDYIVFSSFLFIIKATRKCFILKLLYAFISVIPFTFV